ncbi:hypothetical protein HU200_051127 [Digitaria exilis]|uniref:Uncharacterized protein n=1 Tax=Digitaria exilis TaxID=1010633 RepID=A0A835AWC6_9POAL|nr:hypothetical protein HU200_051127 [Digitaria exilis]
MGCCGCQTLGCFS